MILIGKNERKKNDCLKLDAPLSSAEMATKVSLDALVRREDFDETTAKTTSRTKRTAAMPLLKMHRWFTLIAIAQKINCFR